MSRKLCIEYPGAMYHVMSRGDRREDIFLNHVDRRDLLKTLETTLSPKDIGARVHLGTSKSANARLHQWMRQPMAPDSAQARLQT